VEKFLLAVHAAGFPVVFILNQRRRSNKKRTPLPVDLSRHPELENLSVTPHDLETYDDLAKDDPDEQ
jgi:hypothetical protein